MEVIKLLTDNPEVLNPIRDILDEMNVRLTTVLGNVVEPGMGIDVLSLPLYLQLKRLEQATYNVWVLLNQDCEGCDRTLWREDLPKPEPEVMEVTVTAPDITPLIELRENAKLLFELIRSILHEHERTLSTLEQNHLRHLAEEAFQAWELLKDMVYQPPAGVAQSHLPEQLGWRFGY